MTHASLFSGIGGFDYAAALSGWINIFDCEIDAFCRKVLEYHFPNSVHFMEILHSRIAADPYGKRQKYGNDQRTERWSEPDEQFKGQYILSLWEKFPTQSPICSGDDGLSGRLDGITFSKWRQESVKAYGNAIVPQVAYEIFKAIELCR